MSGGEGTADDANLTARESKQRGPGSGKGRATWQAANDIMEALLLDTPELANQTAEYWLKPTGVLSTSTIHKTPAWKNIMTQRAMKELERRKNAAEAWSTLPR